MLSVEDSRLTVDVNPFTPKFKKVHCTFTVLYCTFFYCTVLYTDSPSLLKGHFDQNPANPKFDLYYSKRKIGIQLADFPKVTPFTRKTPEIHRVEDAKNARPPCWP